MKKAQYIFYIFVSLVVLLSSCHSKKKIYKDDTDSVYIDDFYDNRSDSGEYSKLSRKLGIDVCKNDDIELYREIARWWGAPYKYGGESKQGTDCSGFVMKLYQKVYDVKLHRSSAKILSENCKSISRNKLREGDLVFFATSRDVDRITHVGIYLKNGKFAHASSSKGVIISDLQDNYWQRKWISGGRVKR